MSVETTIDKSRVRDAASCRVWLAKLAADDTGRLLQVDRLLRGLVRSSQAPDLVLEIAEQARPVHLIELAGVIDRLDVRTFPTADSDRGRLLTALESLRLGRNLYKQIHTDLLGNTDTATHSVIPGAAHSLRAVMPLARALDYQARLLIALQRLRVTIDPSEWDEFCVLAQHLRTSTFIDARLPDEAPLFKAGTSRAIFIYPMLVWLAAPYTRTPAEFALIARLARRWAGRIGFRLEEGGGSQDTRHGPSIALTQRFTVRLVTHRLQRRIETRLREIESLGTRAVPRLPRGLSLQATRNLLQELTFLWCEPRSVLRSPDVRMGEMRLRFGFPTMPDPDDQAPERASSAPRGAHARPGQGGPPARPRQPGRKPSSWHSAASRAYIYGRFEHNTLIRMAIGGPQLRDPLALWAADAETAGWVSIERQQAVFEASFSGAGIELGALALLVPPPLVRDPDAAGPEQRRAALPKRIFGRIASLSQQLSSDARRPSFQRVSVAVWSGVPTLVGVRVGDDPFFHDAFLLSPDPGAGEATTLILPEGHFHSSTVASLRDADRDSRIRLEELLDRGPGYDRVRISRLPG